MTSFLDLGLPSGIVQVLSRLGIVDPFPIQEAAIPDAISGRDILGRGPTGSGKTFTFGLPMIVRLQESGVSKPSKPRGLILVPTRELAAQVRERLEEPASAMGLRVLEVVGGVSIKRHITSLASPVDILVATPGRAQDLINQGKLSLSEVEISTLDEADQMADMGFLPQVTKLLELTPKTAQRLFFSATLDGDVNKLVDRFMSDPVTHSTTAVKATVETMSHYRFHVGDREARNSIVEKIAGRDGKTIMFMRTKHGVDRQVKKLRRIGINAAGLHGDKGHNTRAAALAGFADGSVPVLVATDIAARGIDIDDVDLVVHVDPPAAHKAYVHRAGRTARAGTVGKVVTLVMDNQREEVDKLLGKAGVSPVIVDVHADSAELTNITGARKRNGKALQPFGAQQKTSQRGKKQETITQANQPKRGKSSSFRTRQSKSKRPIATFGGHKKKDGQKGRS
ncbi:ATP-dependent helicase [Corynebacterium diphtheriae]|nr:ATP-dependent helicase [Corynebacterium diphtheriae]